MTTTEYTIMACFEEAHGALVAAAKEAHLANHPEAGSISKLIDCLEDIDLKILPKIAIKKEQTNESYSSAPVDIEYGITNPELGEQDSNMSCPQSPIFVKRNYPNFAEEITKNLEKRGESRDFITGFLCGILNGIREQKDQQSVQDFLTKVVKQTETNSV